MSKNKCLKDLTEEERKAILKRHMSEPYYHFKEMGLLDKFKQLCQRTIKRK